MESMIQLSEQILQCCRNELYSLFPNLDGAFASLPFSFSGAAKTIGTDAEHLFCNPEYLIATFSTEPERIRRGYLHILLHCLFQHPFQQQKYGNELWNLACDMAVEQIIRRENQKRLAVPENAMQEQCFAVLGDTPLSAEKISDMLRENCFPFSREEMQAAFAFDDHSLWQHSTQGARHKWQRILTYTSGKHSQNSRKAGSTAGTTSEKAEPASPGVFDYRSYLQRFSVPREEMELDMESFDYIYYLLGMERYGNLPLVEPLEYREGNKLEELVIAIDTSGSCSRETVQNFLRETYSILSRKENFFRKMQVHLIQCDCVVQSAVVIHSEQEWKNYSSDIRIQGRGGTDFTPVFRYVEREREKGNLRNLKALLYFTDGDGAYPREKPDYETAFVFLKHTDKLEAVPKWATILLAEQR